MTSARQSRPVIILFRLRHPESHNGDTDDMSQPMRGEECETGPMRGGQTVSIQIRTVLDQIPDTGDSHHTYVGQ